MCELNLQQMHFWPLDSSAKSCKHNTDISLSYVDIANVLVNSCLLTYPANIEQHKHSFGLMFQFTR